MAKPTIALVGGQTLIGREIRDHAADFTVIPMDSTDDEGKTLVRDEDDLALMSPIDAKVIGDSQVVILAGDLESTAKVRKMRNHELIDLTGALEIDPSARLRAPLAESPGVAPAKIAVIAHPAASLLSLFLRSLHAAAPVARSVATIFHPASEFGTPALAELEQQTTALLTFKALPKKLFDVQAAFAMLAALGDESPYKLHRIELRIERNLTTLLAGAVPLPSLKLVQAPVFHGLSASVWVEFEEAPDLARVAELLAAAGIDVRGKDLEPPNNVSLANQDGIAVGAIEADRNAPKAAWFWMAADNHRLIAQNAILVAKEFVQA
ncbi:Asd/ArgC dimerization domain-containing protein [Bryobacter aggregatus]|uniref:Asd/ArgC dimerization domain-containing protein n=1 Tax=Bryobacter aggregatus TaxID=360054 RepID=UPI00068BF201|nr:Asd/ArgC dimerization domain-containing protein [Bryobacter aggregatus]